MRTIIVVSTPTLEVWGNFKKLCEAKGFPYHSLKVKKFKNEIPLIYKDYTIYRVELK